MSDNPCDIEISGGHLADFIRSGLQEVVVSSGIVASVLAVGLAVTTIDAGHVSDTLTSTKGIQVLEVGHVGDFASGTSHGVSLMLDKGRVRDRVYQGMLDAKIDAGHVGDMFVDRVPSLVGEVGRVGDLVLQTATGGRTTIERGKVRDFFVRRTSDVIADSGLISDFAWQSARQQDSVLEHGHAGDLLLSFSATVDYLAERGHVGDLLSGSAATSQLVSDEGLAEDWVADDRGSVLWTAECETMGMSRLQAHGLESLALLNGQLLGCSPAGLHAFTGPSAPKIATGVTDYGSGFEKRAGYVYVGYNGQPLTITVTASAEGDAVSYDYPMPARTANFSSPGKAKLGRGLRSRYWQFTLSGPQFTLNDVELIMDNTSRKI